MIFGFPKGKHPIFSPCGDRFCYAKSADDQWSPLQNNAFDKLPLPSGPRTGAFVYFACFTRQNIMPIYRLCMKPPCIILPTIVKLNRIQCDSLRRLGTLTGGGLSEHPKRFGFGLNCPGSVRAPAGERTSVSPENEKVRRNCDTRPRASPDPTPLYGRKV